MSLFLILQLLKSLFGTNVASQPEMYVLPYSVKHLVETRGDPTFVLSSGPKENQDSENVSAESSSLNETCFVKPYKDFLDRLKGGHQLDSASPDTERRIR